MTKWLPIVVAAALLAGAATAAAPKGESAGAEATLTSEQSAEFARLRSLARSLHPQFGDVQVAPANATLHLGRDYYFLGADEAKRVLTEGWGNPADSAAGVLGMVFPRGRGFWDDAWAAVITFDPAGFVTDRDADKADYGKLIRDVQSQEDEVNAKRKEGGFPAIHLVGWAQPPSYDRSHHTLVWARDIQFGSQPDHALNYDLRVLGRRGVLSLNMVSTMSRLPEVRDAAHALRDTAVFDSGATFTDYQPGKDKAAGYGVAGLVAAGLGLAAAKKLGLLALILAFGKKAIVVIVAAAAGAVNWGRKWLLRRTGRGTVEPAAAAQPTDAEIESEEPPIASEASSGSAE